MSHSHQSQANLLTTCDNEFSLLAKVSGHSCSSGRNDDVNMNLSAKQTSATCKRNNNSNNNNFNFSRVSLRALKNRIKLSSSHSLTFSQSSSLLLKSSNNNQQQSHDIITNNCIDSFDNNVKNLIKSKSITECLTKVAIDGGVAFGADLNATDDDDDDCNENRVNSISYQSHRFIARDHDVNLLKKQIDKENEADNDEPLGHIEQQSTNDTNQYPKRTMLLTTTTTTNNINSDFTVTNEHDDKSMMIAVSSRGKPASSSCSSSSTTSNENNNEIVPASLYKADQRIKSSVIEATASGHIVDDRKADDDDETKLLNVTQSANVEASRANQSNENGTSFSKVDSIESSSTRMKKPKRPIQPSSKEDLNNDESDLARNNGAHRQRASTMVAVIGAHENDLSQATMLISNCNNGVNTTHSAHVIKTDIPTRAFQRQDYSRPGEDDKGRDINNIDAGLVDGSSSEKRSERKLFKLAKKSGNLFHIPTFGRSGGGSSLSTCGKPMTPSMRNVSLNYPSKTSTIVDCSSEKQRGSLPSRAKYQLIKLGQKCKILTHHHRPATTTTTTTAADATMAASMATMPRLGAHTRLSVIKASRQQQQPPKRHYYNEVNKSYDLDDFIRKTHLLNNMLDGADMENENGFCYDNRQDDDDDEDAIVGYQFDCDGEESIGHRAQQYQQQRANNKNVVYKSYKSEIDLTRNLTYLDAFLNEHFEASPKERSPRQQRHHKRMKSVTKNINYSPKNVNRHDQQQQDENEIFPPSAAMINDESFNDIDTEQQQRRRQASFCDGNVTSSSFEYTTVVKAGGSRKQQQQDLISVGRSITANTATSSSLSSNDYASVFSSEGAAATKLKLISTPEEQQQNDSVVSHNEVTKLTKMKKSRARRSSQPIPELTNALAADDGEQFMLFDDANFIDLQRNLKSLHPDFYNSVPQFEDINTLDVDANFRHYNANADVNAPLSSKRQLSYNTDSQSGIHHRDYLEHFQQQQMLGQQHQHQKRSDANESGYATAMMRNGIRPRTSTYSSSSSSTNHHHNETSPNSFYHRHHAIGSVSDLYGCVGGMRKSTAAAHSQSIASTTSSSSYGPHRVIVSKSKKQKGELVLEYEC